ncbi:MAG: septum formation initiator family protein [Sporolactobacillus sp.]
MGNGERVAQLQNGYLQSQQVAMQRRQHRKKGLIRRLSVFAVLFAIICSVMAGSLVSQTGSYHSLQLQKQSLEKKVNASTTEAKRLKKRIQLLHNKQYIGEIARRDYLLSRKGEIIFSKSENSGH